MHSPVKPAPGYGGLSGLFPTGRLSLNAFDTINLLALMIHHEIGCSSKGQQQTESKFKFRRDVTALQNLVLCFV